MRKLLFFGTGAAVIGILFLILAFYESYLIVNALQRQLGQSVIDTTRLLEDAVLEAVFLGIMAGIGYALISKGLDGIRREELLEAEGVAQVTFGRQQIPSRQGKSRYVARSLSGRAPIPVKREQASGLHPGIKQRITQPGTIGAKVNVHVPSRVMPESEVNEEKSAPEVGGPTDPDTSKFQTRRPDLVNSSSPKPGEESTETAEEDQATAETQA
jgi:hypothetical protein